MAKRYVMEITNSNSVVTLSNQELREALLGCAFKKKPALRPLGTKENKTPSIFINTATIGAHHFVETNHIKDNETMIMIVVPEDAEVCDDKK